MYRNQKFSMGQVIRYSNLAEKTSYIGIISLATTGPGSGSCQVKLISAFCNGASLVR